MLVSQDLNVEVDQLQVGLGRRVVVPPVVGQVGLTSFLAFYQGVDFSRIRTRIVKVDGMLC